MFAACFALAAKKRQCIADCGTTNGIRPDDYNICRYQGRALLCFHHVGPYVGPSTTGHILTSFPGSREHSVSGPE